MSGMTLDLLKATFLGVVEGLTEFIPVSSTGHLLLVQRFLGFDDEDFGKTFAVLIQFGAILALLSIYFARLWALALGVFTDPAARRFVIGVLIAFLPAGVIGALAYHIIKDVLFNVWIVCFMLIVGGAVLIWIDQLDLRPTYHEATKFTLPMYLMIGIAPMLSVHGPEGSAPGRHHRGRDVLLGADKRAAAEFSFWLAMPTMASSAFAYDLYKSHSELSNSNTLIIAVGFAVSFVCAWVAVEDISRLRVTPRSNT